MSDSPFKPLALICALVAALGALPSDASADCANPREAVAIEMRVLQTEMMVGALACQAKPHYNSFARRFEGTLIEQGGNLRRYFQRVHAGSAERRLNAFVTALANDVSQLHANGGTDCERFFALAEAVRDMTPAQLARFVSLRPREGIARPEACLYEAAR